MKKEKVKLNNRTFGFTLVEALVAISILMIAIASPMTLVQKGLSTATLSKDQMIAAFLAQDAIEAVKNIRDQIAISQTSGDWLGAPLSLCVCSPATGQNCNFDVLTDLKFCQIDTTSSDWIKGVLPVSDQGPLKIFSDSEGKFLRYGYNNTDENSIKTDSKFYRFINIKKDPTATNSNEAVVSVRVSWVSPQGLQKIDVQDFIYNYSENL